MADLQKQFEEFHGKIAITKAQDGQLAAKRERVLRRLSDGIQEARKAGKDVPTYRHCNQGSNRIGTGVKPLDGDYDLDVAVIFDTAKDDHDPVDAKSWVYDALEGHTKKVVMRGPCVTVFYQQDAEDAYHLDLAVYAEKNPDGQTYLARGKLNSSGEQRRWEASDPEALLSKIRSQFSDRDERAQFRRVIRYQKRWKDFNFSKDGHAAPKGIALTACAYNWFVVARTYDHATKKYVYDDGKALQGLVSRVLQNFSWKNDAESQKPVERLSVHLPVPPGNDLFERMTNAQMADFKSRLQALDTALSDAAKDADPHTAAKLLAKHFGDDFPIPEKAATAEVSRRPAIVSSGNSG